MKRFLSFIFILGISTAAFAGFPFAGDEIEAGCFDVYLEISNWHDMNPWGMVSPVGVGAIGEVCVDQDGREGVAVLDIQYFANAVCEETPYGVVGDPEECTYYVRNSYSQPDKILVFESGAYIAYVLDNYDEVPFEALVWDNEANAGVFYQGVLEFAPPVFFDFNFNRTQVEWVVEPRSGEVVFPRTRRAGKAKVR